ncbi:MAG: peptidyl-alpha-hydroxyglycine alpha-amidating lyase family protein [Sedimentisphaerales bacterium]
MRSASYSLVALALFLILSGHVLAQPPAAQQSGTTSQYVVDVTWPQKPDHFKWGQMPGITVDNQDQVYIFTRSQPAVQVYKADGTFLRAWNVEDFAGAHYIRIGPAGNVWTANIASHVVRKYSPEGKLLLTLGQPGRAGSDSGHFDRPTDIAVLPTGDIFVSDGYGNRRVVHFDAAGKYIDQWGQEGTEPGRFALPHSIVADSEGRLYVADRENSRIQVFDTKGKLLAVWADLITPWGLWLTKGNELWVCGSSPVRDDTGKWLVYPPLDQILMKLSLKGEVLLRVPLQKTAVPPGKPGELNWVHGIAMDLQGNLYLSDIQGSRAQKFSPKK